MISKICPICQNPLEKSGKSYICKNNHSFDIAKEGYVNLLCAQHKDGSLIGDNKDMAFSRRNFLEKGYFSALCDGVIDYIKGLDITDAQILDICCGEGYYGDRIKKSIDCSVSGFDISKEMVKLAAKRKNGLDYFVANLSRIPVESESVDVGIHLFAPFHEKEINRIIKKDGVIISVIPGENHLFEMKSVLYETPYKNDEKAPETTALELKERIKVTDKIHLDCQQDIDSLFRMTPYYYHTSKEDKEKLKALESLDTTIDFVLLIYKKAR